MKHIPIRCEMTELFDAAPERVFKAWTNKKTVSWYGRRHRAFCDWTLRGGAWRPCIKSPQGEEYWMRGKYVRSLALCIVFTYEDGSGKGKGWGNHCAITFNRIGNKLRWYSIKLISWEIRDSHHGGWSSAFECLREFIEE